MRTPLDANGRSWREPRPHAPPTDRDRPPAGPVAPITVGDGGIGYEAMASVEPAPGRLGGGSGARPGQRSDRALPPVGWLLAGGALVVVAGVGAGAGPLVVAGSAQPLSLHSLPSRRSDRPTATTLPGSAGTARPLPPATGSLGSPGGLGWLLVAVVAAAVAALAVWRWREGARYRVGASLAADPVGVTPAPGDAVPDVRAALRALEDETDARGAVLACWLRLEEAVAATGAARAPAETSGELTRRVLAAHAVDPGSLARLHSLYLLARFSPAPVDAGAPAEARRILHGLRAQVDSAGAQVDSALPQVDGAGAGRSS